MKEQTKVNRILDAHHHFWDLSGNGYYPWLQDKYNNQFFLGDYTAMLHNFLQDEYLKATQGYNIIGSIHMEAERSRTEEVEESIFLKQLHQKNPRFPAAIVGHATLNHSNLSEVLSAHSELGIVRGIRSKPKISSGPHDTATGTGTMQDPKWIDGLSKLVDYNFSWDLRVPYWHLDEAANILKEQPKLSVIINHCGLPLDRSKEGLRLWRNGMEALAKNELTTVKISELGLPNNIWDRTSNEQVIRDTVSIFGYERCMFASNLPVATLTAPNFTEVVDTVLSATQDANETQLDLLFCGTAARVYRIDLDVLTHSPSQS